MSSVFLHYSKEINSLKRNILKSCQETLQENIRIELQTFLDDWRKENKKIKAKELLEVGRDFLFDFNFEDQTGRFVYWYENYKDNVCDQIDSFFKDFKVGLLDGSVDKKMMHEAAELIQDYNELIQDSQCFENFKKLLEIIGEELYAELEKEFSSQIDFYNVEFGKPTSYAYSDEKFLTSKQKFVEKPVKIDEKLSDKIQNVLQEHYHYGLKIDSCIEIQKFRQFFNATDVLPEDNEKLKNIILSVGELIEGKVFAKNDELVEDLKNIIKNINDLGMTVVYYEALFEQYSEWMEEHFITSEEMLKELLQKNTKDYSFSKNFISIGPKKTQKEAVIDEIKHAWGNQKIESVEDLNNKLPYIPFNKIRTIISGNDSFVLVSDGKYFFLDRFDISEEEAEDIFEVIDSICKEKGFASFSDLPLSNIEEKNFELPPFALHNAVYKKILSGKYIRNSKILTKNKPDLDVIFLLKKYIQNKNDCSFNEIAEKVVELTGSTNRQYAFQALYDEMVRVDKNRFVSNDAVSFDTNEIDKVLASFITNHFTAIRDITTFAMFPLCGQSWNHYLLESYCYKYSKKYNLHLLNFNDKNAGIIAEKDYDKNYKDMLALALARMDVELKSETAGAYLFKNGYLAKSKYANLEKIVQMAKELKEEP